MQGGAIKTAQSRWTALIDDVIAGRWVNPDTGRLASVPFGCIVIEDSLAGAEADLVRQVLPAASYAVVCDEHTVEVHGAAVARALGPAATTVVLRHPHPDVATIAALREQTRGAEAPVAVGSGTINDLCKYTTFGVGRAYAVFGTAASMNGYTSTTASITLDSGLKSTLGAHAAKGVFLDLSISAAAPQYLTAAGFGDSLCRPTAQVDWAFSRTLLGTPYLTAPYALQAADEPEMIARSAGLGRGEIEALGYLQRVMTLCGLGISVAGMSQPGSMGEHQISHWIDSFAGPRHPGTVHGQQVGVASVTMARLQRRILASETAPRIRPVPVDEEGIRARYPEAAVAACLKASRAKAMDQAAADAFNATLERVWPTLRLELLGYAMDPDAMAGHIRAAGGGATPQEIGMDPDLYRDALRYCSEMRDRYSMLDLAAGMGILDDVVAGAC